MLTETEVSPCIKDSKGNLIESKAEQLNTCAVQKESICRKPTREIAHFYKVASEVRNGYPEVSKFVKDSEGNLIESKEQLNICSEQKIRHL